MAVVTTDDFREYMGGLPEIPEDSPAEAALQRILDGAQGLIEGELGYKIEEEYLDQPPAALEMAVLMLATHWFMHKSAAAEVSLHTAPFQCRAVIDTYRNRSF